MPLIRITADLHADVPAMEMLLAEVQDYALTLVAGDLTDMFALQAGLQRQREVIHDWMAAMVQHGSWLAWCDGNHDHGLVVPHSDRIISPGQTQLIPDLAIVTSLPWEKEAWDLTKLREPQHLRSSSGLPWIVVSHRPPPSSALGDGDSANGEHVDDLLKEYSPDYYTFGHIHHGPAHHGDCSERFGRTTVINPGRRTEGINTVLLNPGNRAIVWDG